MTTAFRSNSFLIWAALLAIGIAWGGSQYFSKVIVSAGHHPLGISVASTGLGAILITLVAVVTRVPLPISRRHLLFYAVCGFTGTAFPNFTSYTSMKELPLGVMSIVMAAVPMMTFMAAVLTRVEAPDLRRVLGLTIGAGSVLLLILPEASLPRPGDAIWVGIALLTGLSYTVENVYIAKSKPESCTAMTTLVGLSWMALLMVLPLTWATNTWMSHGDLTIDATLVAMTLSHLFAYGGFVWLIGRAGPVFAAQVGYVVTLAGVLLGVLILGETHSGWVWLSLVMMLGGLALVLPKQDDA